MTNTRLSCCAKLCAVECRPALGKGMPIVVDEQAVAAPATVATQAQVSAKASASQAAATKVGSSKGPEKPQVLKVKVEEVPTAAPEPQARASNHVTCGKCPRFIDSPCNFLCRWVRPPRN